MRCARRKEEGRGWSGRTRTRERREPPPQQAAELGAHPARLVGAACEDGLEDVARAEGVCGERRDLGARQVRDGLEDRLQEERGLVSGAGSWSGGRRACECGAVCRGGRRGGCVGGCAAARLPRLTLLPLPLLLNEAQERGEHACARRRHGRETHATAAAAAVLLLRPAAAARRSDCGGSGRL